MLLPRPCVHLINLPHHIDTLIRFESSFDINMNPQLVYFENKMTVNTAEKVKPKSLKLPTPQTEPHRKQRVVPLVATPTFE